MVFVVEDNGYGHQHSDAAPPSHSGWGISFRNRFVDTIDGRSYDSVLNAAQTAIAGARSGQGPTILWIELDRLMSHTNSDDHRVYRSSERHCRNASA